MSVPQQEQVMKFKASDWIKMLDITESGGELRADLSIVDVDSERLRSTCFVLL